MNLSRSLKITLSGLLIFISCQLFAKQKDEISDELKQDLKIIFGKPSENQQAANAIAAQWRLDLNEYLMASDDDLAQIMSLASTLAGIQQSKMMAKVHNNTNQMAVLEQINYQPFATVLNQMIAESKNSVAALNIMTKLCYEKEIAPLCNTNALLDKRMLANSENLQVYLRPFAVANQINDVKLMAQLVQLMANTRYSQTPLSITPVMNDLIDEFINANPVSPEVIQNQIEEYKQLSGISDKMKSQLDEAIPAYMPMLIKSSYQFLTDMPPYKPLLKYCQTNLTAVKSCRKIAEIMIRKSNTLIDKGMGHAVLIASFEAENNEAGIIAAQNLNKQFRQGYECILKLSQTEYFIDDYFDPVYQTINNQAKDEYEKLIQLADWRYGKLLTAGNEEAINPETCFDTD